MLERLALIAGLAILTLAIDGCAHKNIDPLPTAAQVKSITINFHHRELEEVTFAATANDWKTIRATLLPAKLDQSPSTWESLGTANIVKLDGTPYRVELYNNNKDPGAFAAGKTLQSRVYYRGGKSAVLYKALVAAFDKAPTREVDPARVRGRFRSADTLKIKVAKDAGGFYDEITLVDSKEKDDIEPLIAHLKFIGNAIPREPGSVGTTAAADITAIRKGKALETLQLRGNEIWFGPDHGYKVKLEKGDLYRSLRELAGDPLP